MCQTLFPAIVQAASAPAPPQWVQPGALSCAESHRVPGMYEQESLLP